MSHSPNPTPGIARIEAHVFRAPTPRPVATSFGVMRDRPAVFIRVEDSEGAFGWGEIFANWPASGAEHRARLLAEDIAPLVLGQPAGDPTELWRRLSARVAIRALQCGEPGPFAQVLAGIDTALSDLAARRAGLPLARWLDAGAADSVTVYASGLQVSAAADGIAASRRWGIAAFKVKIGFDRVSDLRHLTTLAGDLAPGEQLMADANQAWDREATLAFLADTATLPLGWLEEPIAANAPAADWAAIAATSPHPLAGGENIAGEDDFDAAIGAGHLAVIQPDVAKWGGVTGNIAVARSAIAAGRRYCPHFLGGGIGLVASAHLLAAARAAPTADGILELDANENPLRDAFFDADPVEGGSFRIAPALGLGIDRLPEGIERFRTLHLNITAPRAS
ncbi:MAG: mandelate racemase/muconate lactonizing enzyme family protein [Pseudomonadota bacterium]